MIYLAFTPRAPGIAIPDAIAQITMGNVVAAILSFLGILAILISSRKMLKPFIDSIKNFMEDWNGEPARPGVDRRLGVMEQLSNLSNRLATVEHEVRPNEGQSMHDKISRIETQVTPKEETDDARKMAGTKK